MATGRVPTTANSPLTAKGDLFTYSTAPARLAVGNDGDTIVADSSTSTGLRYTAGTVQANPVLNSAMQVWQRGTSISLAASTAYSAGFVADRYQTGTGANQACTISRQATGDSTNLPFIQYALRYQRNSGQTGIGSLYIVQSFESVNSIPFAGKTITFSFYARAGANFSSTSNLLNVYLRSGTGTDQNVITAGYTGQADVVASTATLTTTWQRFTYTGSVASTATELGFLIGFTPTGTAGANDYYEITGLQIDIGSVALPFRTYAGTIQGELAACQRYYWRSTGGAAYSVFGGNCSAWSTVDLLGGFNLPVTMRTNPTSVEYSSLIASDGVNNNSVGTLTFSSAYSSPNVGGFSATSTSLTAFRFYRIQANNSTSAYIAYSAEL